MPEPAGRIASLSVKPRTAGEPGLPKQPVAALRVTAAGAEGDYNRYRAEKLQGDPDSAILLLTSDVLEALRQEGWTVAPGHLGENVLLEGIANTAFSPGRRVRIGAVLLEVSRACDPCSELYTLPYVGRARGPEFVRTLQGRRGWYARVLAEGTLRPGDQVRLESNPE